MTSLEQPEVARSSYKWMVLLIASIAAFMNPFDAGIVNLALPTIANELGASLTYLVWIPTIYLLVAASLQTSMGRLGDSKGKRNLFLIGIALFTLGSFFAGTATDVFQLIADRGVQGAGAAIMSVISISILADAFPLAERGRAFGINVMSVYIGLTLGPVAGGFLVQTLGWRAIFYVNVPIGLLAIVLGLMYLHKDEGASEKPHFDFLGASLFTLFLSALLLGLSQADLGWPVTEVILLDVVGFAALVCLVYVEYRVAKEPVLDLRLFKLNRLLSAGVSTALLNYMTSLAALLMVSLYLQLVLKLSPFDAGIVLLVQPIIMVIASPIAGILSDRMSPRIICAGGMLSRSIGFFALSQLGVNSSSQSVWIPLLLVGLGHGFFSSPNMNSVMSSVKPEQFGLASGVLGTIRTAGNSVGIAILGAVVAARMPAGVFASLTGGASIPAGSIDSLAGGISTAFLLASALSLVGVFTSLSSGNGKS